MWIAGIQKHLMPPRGLTTGSRKTNYYINNFSIFN
ncbi:proline/betaine transporter [Rickettsia sp. R2]